MPSAASARANSPTVSWGDLTRTQYQAQRDAIDRALATLQPAHEHSDALAVYRQYLDDLPAEWADATPEMRNQLANALYSEIWVDGPRVEYVRPQPGLEPLFQVREGAAQPLAHPGHEEAPHVEGLSHSMVAEATPMGFEPTISTVTGWHV